MPFIDLDGRPFFHERQGTGERLLFLGGTGGDLRRPETQFAGPLARQFELATFDQRGQGQSFKGTSDTAFTMADYADDAAALMAAMAWRDAHVIGVSFGGMVAQELALRHPTLVRRLILCCTSSGGAGGASFPYHTLPPMDAGARAELMLTLSDTRRDAAWKKANPAQYRLLLGFAAADPYASEPGHVEGAARQLAARATHDTWDRLPEIACPTLVMGGRHDGIAKPDNQRALAARIPNAELRFFEGGHLFMLEDRTAYDAMTAFLSR